MILLTDLETPEECVFMLDSGIRFRVSPIDKMFVVGSRRKWRLSGWGYICRGSGGDALHLLIAERMGLDCGQTIDHRDVDKTNDRRDNLREANRTEQQRNHNIHSQNQVGYKGVSYIGNSNKFRASIKLDGKQKHLGSFDSAEAAAEAYNVAALIAFGEFARLN